MILDRYIIWRFIQTYVFAIFALCLIFVVVDLLDHLDDFMDKSAEIKTIAQYYLYYIPRMIEIVTPIACLLAVLFTVGGLSSQNELTAMKSGGISLFRIMIPFVIVGTMLSGFMIYFNGWVVPQAHVEKFKIEAIYMNKNESGGPIYNFYFRDSPNTNFSLQYYNSDKYFGAKPAVDSFSLGKSPRLLKRIEANNIQWDTINSKWLFLDAIVRDYSNHEIHFTRQDTVKMDLSITHNELVKLKKQLGEMNYDEVRAYIKMLKNGGKDVRQQMIEYYGNYAFCFANIIVMLFGVPFASVKRKSGMAMQIGAALVISFLYLISMKFSQTIGYAQNWDPILAGWMANFIFLGLGVVVIFRTRT